MTRLRRPTQLTLLLVVLVPMSGCGIFGGRNDGSYASTGGPSAERRAYGDPALLAPPSIEMPAGNTAAREAQRPTVRAQNSDYRGDTGTYGGRNVGAVAPGEASRVRPAQFSQPANPYPNTPGAAAWGNPAGNTGNVPPNYYPTYSAPPAYAPNGAVPSGAVPSNSPTGTFARPPANYASPSFNNAGSGPASGGAVSGGAIGGGAVGGGAVGANRPTDGFGGTVPPPPANSFVPGRAVSAPGGFRPGPGINSGSGGSAMVDPLEPVGPPKFVDIDAIVHETRTGRMMIGAGINSDAGLIGQFVIDEQNFDWKKFPRSWDDVRNGYAWRGDGQRFRFEAMPGTSVQRYLMSWQEPYLFDTRFTLGLSGFFYDRRFYDWDEGRLGGRVAVGYQLPRDWTVTAAFRGEEVEITNPRVFPPVPEVAGMLGTNTLMGVKLSLGHDTRDDAFLPTQGHIVEFGHEQVFGSFEYGITTFEARQFFTLTERIDGSGRHVLHVGGQAGWAGSETPAYDHFYAGGYSTIRGFGFRGASPKSGDVIVGGEFQLLGTAEYMFPITADDMLRGVAFVDAGTVEESHKIDWGDFRIAPGFGLRISNAALGPAPIALDLAFPIAHEDGDKIRNFSFFIGLRY